MCRNKSHKNGRQKANNWDCNRIGYVFCPWQFHRSIYNNKFEILLAFAWFAVVEISFSFQWLIFCLFVLIFPIIRVHLNYRIFVLFIHILMYFFVFCVVGWLTLSEQSIFSIEGKSWLLITKTLVILNSDYNRKCKKFDLIAFNLFYTIKYHKLPQTNLIALPFKKIAFRKYLLLFEVASTSLISKLSVRFQFEPSKRQHLWTKSSIIA